MRVVRRTGDGGEGQFMKIPWELALHQIGLRHSCTRIDLHVLASLFSTA